MSFSLPLNQRNRALLLTILLVAFLLRIFRLGFESLWLDEIYVMIEADPHQPLQQLFHYLKCCDQHPPLFYLGERCMFFLFGQSEATARVLPALAGVAGVWAMYKLGKEILNERLGLVAAALACVNHFCLYYSREARGYSFAFLFAALSLAWLLRLIKRLEVRDMWLYSLFALLTIYSHYFGLFLIFSQFCAAALLFLPEKNKKLYARRFIISGILILAGGIPLFPFLQGLAGIHSFWIGGIPGNWLFTYFSNYFDNSNDIRNTMLVFLAVYVAVALTSRKWKWRDVKESPLGLSIIVLGTTVLLTYGVPYIRSLMVVPMLQDRYTIVILPALLVAIAYGITLIPVDYRLKWAGVFFLMGWSLQKEIGFRKIYSRHYKTQFREVTAYMATDSTANQYPVINDRIAWFESYYLRKFDYRGKLMDGARSATIDSILNSRSPAWKTDGFWLMEAHGAGEPGSSLDSVTRQKVDSLFVKVKEQRFLDAWAQLYLRKPGEELKD
jgi:4-amino-4-deoxy-L-arabinose transferase-like glycosyltransferase